MSIRIRSLVPFVLVACVLALSAQGLAYSKDKKQKPEAVATDAAFDESDAAQVLGILRDGMEGHSERLFLSAFDSSKMPDALSFQDQLDAWFTRYEGFRVTLRILQVSQEEERGIILANFQTEGDPRGGGRPIRREAQLRFELVRTEKGWKIVELSPRGFFS